MCHNYSAQELQLLSPVHLEPMLHNRRGHHRGRHVHHSERVAPCSPQLEKTRAQQGRPGTAKTEKSNKGALQLLLCHGAEDFRRFLCVSSVVSSWGEARSAILHVGLCSPLVYQEERTPKENNPHLASRNTPLCTC